MKHFLFKCQRLKNFITKTNFDSAALIMVLLANSGGLRWSWLSLDSKFLWAKHTPNHNRPLIFSWDHQISFEKLHGIVGKFLYSPAILTQTTLQTQKSNQILYIPKKIISRFFFSPKLLWCSSKAAPLYPIQVPKRHSRTSPELQAIPLDFSFIKNKWISNCSSHSWVS